MKILFAAFNILAFTMIQTLASICPVFRCKDDSVTLGENICVGYRTDKATNFTFYEIDHSQCDSAEICLNAGDSKKNTNCTLRHATREDSGIDQTPCQNNKECWSGLCEAGVCVGGQDNSTCISDKACGIGFYCQLVNQTTGEQRCTGQKAENEACENDMQCQNNLGCCKVNKVCVPYFSYKDLTPVEYTQRHLCESNYIHNGLCVSPLRLDPTDECAKNQTECTYEYTGVNNTIHTFALNCQCSPAYSDKKFCPMVTQDKPFSEAIPKVKSWFEGDGKSVHTVLRYLYPADLKTEYLQTFNYPFYKDADKCYMDFFVGNGSFLKSILLLAFLVIFI